MGVKAFEAFLRWVRGETAIRRTVLDGLGDEPLPPDVVAAFKDGGLWSADPEKGPIPQTGREAAEAIFLSVPGLRSSTEPFTFKEVVERAAGRGT